MVPGHLSSAAASCRSRSSCFRSEPLFGPRILVGKNSRVEGYKLEADRLLLLRVLIANIFLDKI